MLVLVKAMKASPGRRPVHLIADGPELSLCATLELVSGW